MTSFKALIFFAISAVAVCGASWLVATRTVTMLEETTVADLAASLSAADQNWAEVRTDGLQVKLVGEAPSEGARFRALEVAAQVVDTSRITDEVTVASPASETLPDFALEILRNGNDISLVGLMPDRDGRLRVLETIADLHEGGTFTDLLEALDYPAPEGWTPALDFALARITELPRARIAVAPGAVRIEASLDSDADRAEVSERLTAAAPDGIALDLHITAPRPVRSPFVFAARVTGDTIEISRCDLGSDAARAALRQVPGADTSACEIAVGAPSGQWGEAVVLSLETLRTIGGGTVEMRDADIALTGTSTTDEAAFEAAMTGYRANLPDGFSLTATLPAPDYSLTAAPAEVRVRFTAQLDEDGMLRMTGPLRDGFALDAVRNYAAALFGHQQINSALTEKGSLPAGWTARVLAGLKATSHLHHASLVVSEDSVRLDGVSIEQEADEKARAVLLTVFDAAKVSADIRFDAALKRIEAAPDARECEKQLAMIMRDNNIVFAPSSSDISNESELLLDKIASIIMSCANARFEIGGHTDSQGREEMNLALSQARADAVLDALLARNVLLAHMEARGYGETEPIAPNETEEGRAANRRIAFKLVTPEEDDETEPTDAETDASDEQN